VALPSVALGGGARVIDGWAKEGWWPLLSRCI